MKFRWEGFQVIRGKVKKQFHRRMELRKTFRNIESLFKKKSDDWDTYQTMKLY